MRVKEVSFDTLKSSHITYWISCIVMLGYKMKGYNDAKMIISAQKDCLFMYLP